MPTLKKILIADRNSDFRKELDQKMRKAGYQVFQAVSEDSALEVLEDIKMDLVFFGPSLDTEGALQEFLQKLRRTFLGRNVPLLLAPSGKKKTDPILRRQGAEYLPLWPMNLDELLVYIEKWLPRFKVLKMAQPKVLVAATANEVTDSMVQVLRKKGYEADSAASGSETISKVVQMKPDILVLDVLIERVVPEDIVRIAREMPEFEKKPILLFCYYRLSDLDREEIRSRVLSIDDSIARCKQAGADDYIGRYNETAFLEIVGNHLL